ncbi:tyrosine-type recombinase/integrase [Candidatus Nitrosotenuis cloacae]|uniref:tyrosine-type recombinase/integrase n=1 Tax=Candidatus Nitrosotenuis cloacae TaxID=1603555 RepID=UPI00069B5511|nr:tyrosine-type recombinase/integrase [Candidatus Nitrosotenuis cloacae]
MKRDIYECKKRLAKAISLVKESTKISEQNKKIILDFIADCQIDGAGWGEPLSIPRVGTYAFTLRKIAEWLEKDFDRAEKGDIKRLLISIEAQNIKPHTKQFFKVSIKKLYKWLNGGEDYPELVRQIKTNLRKMEYPWDLLTEQDIIKMIEAEGNPRNRALIMTLAESGCRVGELASLDIKDVIFDDLGIKILVDGKTGQRPIRLLASAPYLAAWINVHPQKNNPQSPLWINIGHPNHGQAMKYEMISALLKRAANKAGITKRVNPHSFRHARATVLGMWMGQSQRCVYMGWVKNSRMSQIYDHLTGVDTEGSLLEMCGMETKTKKESLLKPKVCQICQEWNEVTALVCKKCAKPFEVKIAIDIDEKRVKDIKAVTDMITPEVLEGLVKKIIKSKFEELIKIHPNANAFLDSLAEKG